MERSRSALDRGRILIVEDDAEMRGLLEEHLRGEGHQVRAASGGEAALRALREAEFDLVLTDLKMSGVDGMEVLGAARAAQPGARVILITAFGTIESAIEAMRQGAFHYATKPFRLPEIRLVVERALADRRLRDENRRLREEVAARYRLHNLLGASPAMQTVFSLIRQAGPADVDILITGESGTGKELVAKAAEILGVSKRTLYRWGKRLAAGDAVSPNPTS